MTHPELIGELERLPRSEHTVLHLHPATLPLLQRICGYGLPLPPLPAELPVLWTLLGIRLEFSNQVRYGTLSEPMTGRRLDLLA